MPGLIEYRHADAHHANLLGVIVLIGGRYHWSLVEAASDDGPTLLERLGGAFASGISDSYAAAETALDQAANR